MNLRGKDCYVVAKQNGYSEKDTDRCEKGSLNCQGCKFFKGAKLVLTKQKAIDEMIEFAKQHLRFAIKNFRDAMQRKGYSHAMVMRHSYAQRIMPLNAVYFTGPLRELQRREILSKTAQRVWDSNIFESD